jgi:hypothetical protein
LGPAWEGVGEAQETVEGLKSAKVCKKLAKSLQKVCLQKVCKKPAKSLQKVCKIRVIE